MFKNVVVLISLFFSVALFGQFGQVRQTGTWSYDASKKEVKVGDEIDIIFRVDLIDNWYIYSSDLDPEIGPTPTTVAFNENESFELIGDLIPTDPKKKYEDVWGAEVTYFLVKGEFKQKIKVLNKALNLSGLLEFQTCSDLTGQCIPGEKEFTIEFIIVSGEEAQKEAQPELESVQEEKVEVKKAEAPTGESFDYLLVPEDDGSLWGFFIAAFVFGLAGLLTPCVFPMIPMTVAFFTNSSQSRSQAITKAVIYGISIIVIYILIGLLFTSLFGVGIANELATGAIPNIIFFLVFVLFALSFFGLFEIVLPSGFVNRMDKKANNGGFIGTFFMAFTLVLVSFSCTGPIVGTILIESFQGQVLKPVVGMLGFSIAFAIPFTLFAIFPGMLKELPKSGGWLNSVKVVLGFIELALAFKFLSIADQAYHWGLLDRDIYIAIWFVIAILLGFYLLGKIKLPHDSPSEKTSVPRLILAIISFVFAIYLFPGLFGAPLKGLSGYLPPLSTHDFSMKELI
ncbi:MAG: thiol:disulfide interchange protein DsbD, partial [Candidatus Endobugula sp.]